MTKYLIFILYILSFLVFLLFLIIIAYHQNQTQKKKKLKEIKNKYLPVIDDYVNNRITIKNAEHKLKKDMNYEIIEEVLKSLLKKYSGSKFESLKDLIKHLGINNHYLKNLNSNNKKKKLKAASFLGVLEEKKALDELYQMLNSQDRLVIITAAWAISEIGNMDNLDKIIKSLIKKTNMTYEATTELLVNFNGEICDKLINHINRYLEDTTYFSIHFAVDDYKLLALFIDIFGYFRYKRSLSIIKRLLKRNPHQEVIIHILKSLVKIGEPINLDLKKFLLHENWVIRSQTTKYISKIKNSNYINIIKNLLEDENWWVKYYAAKALWDLDKIDLMIDIILKDKTGANICDYILAQNNYNYILEERK